MKPSITKGLRALPGGSAATKALVEKLSHDVAAPRASTIKSGIYYIRSSDGALSIDCPGGSREEALELKCVPSANIDSQKWAITANEVSGTYIFQNVASGNYIGAHYPENSSKLPPTNVIGGPICSAKAVPWQIKMSQAGVYSIRDPDINCCFNNPGTNIAMTFAFPTDGTQKLGVDYCKPLLASQQLWTFEYAGPLVPSSCPSPKDFVKLFPNTSLLKTGVYVLSSVAKTGRNLGVEINNCEEGAPLTPVAANNGDPYQHWELTAYSDSLTYTLRNVGCGLYLSFPYFDRKPPYSNDDWKVPCTLRSRAKHWSIHKEEGGSTLNMPGTRWQINTAKEPACALGMFSTPGIPLESKFKITMHEVEKGTTGPKSRL